MLRQFYIPEPDRQSADLVQYCKMENVLPGTLKCAAPPKKTFRIRLEKLAFDVLQPINKGLGSLVARLTADLEHHGEAQRYYS